MKKIAQALFIVLTLTLAGAAVAGATVEVVKVKDKSMLASFSNSVFTQCGGSNSAVDVQWNSSLIKSDGTTTLQSAVVLSLHYVDICTGDDIIMTGFALNTNGSVATDLSRGHLDAVVPVSTDPDAGPFLTSTLNVSLNLTATGPATTIRDRSHSRDGGVITMSNFLVSSRPAVASGTVTGTLPLLGGPTPLSLIAGQSVSAQIGKDANGTMTIVRKTP